MPDTLNLRSRFQISETVDSGKVTAISVESVVSDVRSQLSPTQTVSRKLDAILGRTAITSGRSIRTSTRS